MILDKLVYRFNENKMTKFILISSDTENSLK